MNPVFDLQQLHREINLQKRAYSASYEVLVSWNLGFTAIHGIKVTKK